MVPSRRKLTSIVATRRIPSSDNWPRAGLSTQKVSNESYRTHIQWSRAKVFTPHKKGVIFGLGGANGMDSDVRGPRSLEGLRLG